MNPTQKSMYEQGGLSSKPTPYELGERSRKRVQEQDVQPDVVAVQGGQAASVQQSPVFLPPGVIFIALHPHLAGCFKADPVTEGYIQLVESGATPKELKEFLETHQE